MKKVVLTTQPSNQVSLCEVNMNKIYLLSTTPGSFYKLQKSLRTEEFSWMSLSDSRCHGLGGGTATEQLKAGIARGQVLEFNTTKEMARYICENI